MHVAGLLLVVVMAMELAKLLEMMEVAPALEMMMEVMMQVRDAGPLVEVAAELVHDGGHLEVAMELAHDDGHPLLVRDDEYLEHVGEYLVPMVLWEHGAVVMVVVVGVSDGVLVGVLDGVSLLEHDGVRNLPFDGQITTFPMNLIPAIWLPPRAQLLHRVFPAHPEDGGFSRICQRMPCTSGLDRCRTSRHSNTRQLQSMIFQQLDMPHRHSTKNHSTSRQQWCDPRFHYPLPIH